MGKTVRVIGDGVPYLDGAEDELLEFMKNAEDRSIGSDELAAGIHDWPSMYHLSRARANLLMPFNISANHRVLDVGCGTGALTRQFAEWGSQVTGLEGSYERSLVACERVREFENAEIVNGSLEEYVKEGHSEEFDVILLCGVLEYSGAIFGGADGPDKMLTSVNSLLSPNGIAIIAIENQLGMKYLLGFNEDHLGCPWIGLSDYHLDDSGIRTWTRSALTNLLSRNGLTETRWFGSFPDYKIPSAIISDELWQQEGGKQIARQFIRNPIVDYSSEPQFKSDPLTFWNLFLQTEYPQDFVNSHLVIASKSSLKNSPYVRPELLWSGHNSRFKKYSTRKILKESNLELKIELISPGTSTSGDLVFSPKHVDLVVGENMEDWMVSELRGKSLDESIPVFAAWWEQAIQVLRNAENEGLAFDLLPRNFVKSGHKWVYVDSEWFWKGNLEDSIVLIRNLIYVFSDRLMHLSLPLVPNGLTLGQLVLIVAKKLAPSVVDSDLELCSRFESAIQGAVTGVSQIATFEHIQSTLNMSIDLLRYSSNDLNLVYLKHVSQQELQVSQQELQVSQQELQVSQQELQVSQQELQVLSLEINAIKDSRSWRITSPLRTVLDWVKTINN
jgi:SAM-dependent methyltransferase